MFAMKSRFGRSVAIVLATSTLALTAGAAFSPAEAQYRRHYYRGGNAGAAAAVGIIGGLAAGALIAGAARPAYAAPRVYDVGPAYPAAPVYAEEYYEPVCHWERRSVWVGPNTYQVRRVKVCE